MSEVVPTQNKEAISRQTIEQRISVSETLPSSLSSNNLGTQTSLD